MAVVGIGTNKILHIEMANSNPRKILLPFSVFLKAFGLYPNAYHSLKGIYTTPAEIDVDNRTLMIGPFGAHEFEMASCLADDSREMGAGKVRTLDTGERVFVIVFQKLQDSKRNDCDTISDRIFQDSSRKPTPISGTVARFRLCILATEC